MKENNTNLDSEVFSGMLGFGNIILFLHTLHSMYFDSNTVLISINWMLMLIFLILYFVDRKYKIFEMVVFPLSNILLISLAVIYFFKGGYYGPVFYYFLMVGFAYSILLSDFRRTFLLILQGSLMICLVLLQNIFPDIVQNHIDSTKMFNELFAFILAFAFLIFVAILVRKHHDYARRRIFEQNIEADFKNREIVNKNNELRKNSLQIDLINKKLNQLVIDRTAKIENQNSKLIEYAFFNSHKVRGPLARVLGLVELIKNCREEEELALYLSKLEESATELDTVVSDINKILVD